MPGVLRRVAIVVGGALAFVVAVAILSGLSGRARPHMVTRPRAVPTSPAPASAATNQAMAGGIIVLDAFRTDAQSVTGLRAQGLRPACRLDAGGWEPARPDAARFDPSVIGRSTGDPDGSRWIDVRRWDLLAPILASRLDLCRGKGFDAVVVDHVDGYAHPTGFPISLADQRRFTGALAALAHARGLRVGCVRTSAATGGLDFSLTGPAGAPSEARTTATGDAAGSADTSTTTGS